MIYARDISTGRLSPIHKDNLFVDYPLACVLMRAYSIIIITQVYTSIHKYIINIILTHKHTYYIIQYHTITVGIDMV